MLSIVVTYSDGTEQIFENGDHVQTDVDWFRTASEYRIYDSHYNIIVLIPMSNVRSICKID
jgi:hypothetical protein